MDPGPQRLSNRIGRDPSGTADSVPFLSDPRRVAILAELADHGGSVTTAALARRVAAVETGKRAEAVSSREERIIHSSLRHTHLPALSARSLIAWDRDAETVRLSTNVSVSRLRRFLQGRSSTASSRLLRTLSNSRRRLIVSLLATDGAPMSVEELARRVAAEERSVDPESLSETEIDHVHVSLIHSHLPALSSAEFIEYDKSAGIVKGMTAMH